ncbi:MAG: hypothetical protein WC451_02560 [Patescibacteria group bacterium]
MAEATWYARHAYLQVADTLATVDPTKNLSGATQGVVAGQTFTNSVESRTLVENVEISEGDMDIEPLNTLGNTQKANEKRPTMYTVTMDMVFSDISRCFGKRLMGTEITGASGYTRYQGGEKATTATHRAKCLVALQVMDGTNFDNALLNNAWVTKIERKNGAEDYGKCTVTAKCLAQDYYEEFNGY